MNVSSINKLQRLPLDLSTFSEFHSSNYLYVDKTEHAYNLITEGRRFFLSRPRRFGKSLFVSTLKEILSGNKKLFTDLWIEKSDYDWKEHGVIVLDFSNINIKSAENFIESLIEQFSKIIEFYSLDVKFSPQNPEVTLSRVVIALHKKFKKVALLIDEYDSAILHTSHDIELQTEIKRTINRFFSAIKSLDEYVNFVFITGVASFSKAGLFSGMNNLQIVSLDDQYGAICGYTDVEIDTYFREYIQEWADKKNTSYQNIRQQLKEWYNGYRFGENVSPVYSPFSFMHALKKQKFENFWFQSATPTFLINELKKEYRKNELKMFLPESQDQALFRMTDEGLQSFEIGETPLEVIMFQTGYLTIKEYFSLSRSYSLQYPNYEVKQAMQQYFLSIFVHIEPSDATNRALNFVHFLEQKNTEQAIDILRNLFAQIPYQLHAKQSESFYHAILQAICMTAGIKLQSEYSMSSGRIDMVWMLDFIIYIVEIKLNDSAENALKQIEEREYYKPFLNQNKQIHLLGISFKKEPKKFIIDYVEKVLIC